MKLRADSTLAKLTQDQLDQLFDWCREHGIAEVQELAAKPAPEGLALKIHKTTLARFFREETKRRHAEELSQLAAEGAELNSELRTQDSELANLVRAARAEFAHAIYDLSLAAAEPENFDRLERSLHHLDAVAIRRDLLQMKEKEFALARERFEFEKIQWQFNAARVAVEHRASFGDILKNDQTDNEDKIWQAREVCFGELPPAMDTLKHTVAEKLSPQSSVLETDAPRPDTLKHTNDPRAELVPIQSGFPSVQDQIGGAASAPSASSAVKTSDTLKHTTENSSSLPSVQNPDSEKLSPQSSVPATVGQPAVPIMNPGKMPYSHWIKRATDREAIEKLIFVHFSKALKPYHQKLIATDGMVWTDNEEILRLIA